MKTLRVLFCILAAAAVVSCSAGSKNSVIPSGQGGSRQGAARHVSLPSTASAATRKRMDSTGALVDGGFESGGYTYWSQCGNVNASISSTYYHTGKYAEAAGTGSGAEINGDAGLCQQVTIPSGGTLTFWVKQGSNESNTTYAYQEGDLLDSTGAVVDNFYTTVSNTSGWVQKTVNLSSYAGQSLWIYFGVHGDGSSGYWTYQDVDDVAWSGTSTPTPSPTATPVPTATPAPTPTPTKSPTPAPTPTKSPTPAPTPTKTPTPAPTSTPTPSGGPTPIATPANGGGNSTGSCGTSCGVQRWHIKTLGDAYVNTINWTPALVTVDQMRAAAVPANYDQYNDTTRYAPWETKSVTVRATLVGWKIETDHDYHMVIADMNHPSDTMIIEPPDPTCSSACDGGFANYFSAVRTKLTNCFGQPPSSFTNFPSGIVVDVTGVPEFDALHGQTGVAPNGIEIHPLMNINFVSGTTCK